MAKEKTRRIALDLTEETIDYIDHCKARGEFGSRSRTLENLLPRALEDWEERQDAITDAVNAEQNATLQETATTFVTDFDRISTPHPDDPQAYGGHAIGDAVTLFFQNPKAGKIVRIWRTSKGHRLVVSFEGGGYAVLKPVDLQKAMDAAARRAYVDNRNNSRGAA